MNWETTVSDDEQVILRHGDYSIHAVLLDESWFDRTLQQWEITVRCGVDVVYAKKLEVQSRDSLCTIIDNISQQYP
jgi:hypothetical protein